MITPRVTQLTLTRTTEARDAQWRVEWTEVRGGKVAQSRTAYFTEAAACQHVEGLLKQRAAGLSVDAVYSETLR